MAFWQMSHIRQQLLGLITIHTHSMLGECHFEFTKILISIVLLKKIILKAKVFMKGGKEEFTWHIQSSSGVHDFALLSNNNLRNISGKLSENINLIVQSATVVSIFCKKPCTNIKLKLLMTVSIKDISNHTFIKRFHKNSEAALRSTHQVTREPLKIERCSNIVVPHLWVCSHQFQDC